MNFHPPQWFITSRYYTQNSNVIEDFTASHNGAAGDGNRLELCHCTLIYFQFWFTLSARSTRPSALKISRLRLTSRFDYPHLLWMWHKAYCNNVQRKKFSMKEKNRWLNWIMKYEGLPSLPILSLVRLTPPNSYTPLGDIWHQKCFPVTAYNIISIYSLCQFTYSLFSCDYLAEIQINV